MKQPHADVHDIHASGVCRNCDGPAPGNYCPACGQETSLHPPSLGEFLHEFFSHYVAIDGPLFGSLRALLFKPGLLTTEYLAGRKRRYLLPLRLYLTISLCVIVCLSLSSQWRGERFYAKTTGKLDNVHIIDFGLPAPRVTLIHGEFSCTGLPQWGCDNMKERFGRSDEDLREEMIHLPAHIFKYMAYSLFAMVLAFAGLMQLFFRKKRLLYGEHLVFAFHMHGVGLLAMLLMQFVPDMAKLAVLVLLLCNYLLAVKRAYEESWSATFVKAVLVGVLDLAVIVLVGTATGVTALML